MPSISGGRCHQGALLPGPGRARVSMPSISGGRCHHHRHPLTWAYGMFLCPRYQAGVVTMPPHRTRNRPTAFLCPRYQAGVVTGHVEPGLVEAERVSMPSISGGRCHGSAGVARLSCGNMGLCERLGGRPLVSGRYGLVKVRISGLSCVRALPRVAASASALASLRHLSGGHLPGYVVCLMTRSCAGGLPWWRRIRG
jgi:hypothetical protein